MPIKRSLAFASLLFLCAFHSFGEKPMNVILFLVDDWGWTDGGVFGSDLYETPNIDELANKGIRFTNAYAACTVCSPSRSAVMTGLYPARTHVTDWISGHSSRYENRPLLEPEWTKYLDLNHTTIAELLKNYGYKTASVGKWHLTPNGEPGGNEVSSYWPEHHGFDVNIAGNQYGAPGSYFAPFSGKKNRQMYNMPKADDGAYLTDRLTDKTVDLINEWKDQPFFIYLPYYAVHTPLQGKKQLIEKYKAKIRDGMHHTNPIYAAMVQSVDESVGRILETLDKNQLDENTLIILTGDNGGLDPDDTGRITNNYPLRNGKGSVYEGGVRVPCVIYHPKGVQGSVNETPVISNDFFPTIGAIVTGQNIHSTDGIDLSPIITNDNGKIKERDLYWHYPHYHVQGATPYSAIRSGNYRLIEYHLDGNVELYDLKEDIGETTDLSRDLPHIVQKLKNKLGNWKESIDAQMPPKNPAYNPEQPTLKPSWARKKK